MIFIEGYFNQNLNDDEDEDENDDDNYLMMEKRARNFREYAVWRAAVEYATYVYSVTGQMPWIEKRGLGDQLQRAVVSISSNITEGCGLVSAEEASLLCRV